MSLLGTESIFSNIISILKVVAWHKTRTNAKVFIEQIKIHISQIRNTASLFDSTNCHRFVSWIEKWNATASIIFDKAVTFSPAAVPSVNLEIFQFSFTIKIATSNFWFKSFQFWISLIVNNINQNVQRFSIIKSNSICFRRKFKWIVNVPCIMITQLHFVLEKKFFRETYCQSAIFY
jgi:hypothetical protein